MWRDVTLGNDNGTDGQTDRRTDRVRRIMRPPPREEGRIIKIAGTLYKRWIHKTSELFDTRLNFKDHKLTKHII